MAENCGFVLALENKRFRELPKNHPPQKSPPFFGLPNSTKKAKKRPKLYFLKGVVQNRGPKIAPPNSAFLNKEQKEPLLAQISGAQGPPQFLKKRSENAGTNENLSGGFAAIPGIAPRVAPRIVGFVLLKS